MKSIVKKLIVTSLCFGIIIFGPITVLAQKTGKKTGDKFGEYDQIIIKRKGTSDWEFSTKGEKGEKGSKGKKGDKDIKLVIEINDDRVHVNGEPLAEFNDDRIAILKKNIIVRDGNTMRITVPQPPRSPFLGEGRNFEWNDGDNMVFNFSGNGAFLGVSSEASENGAMITEVTKESAAEKAGLKAGDVIMRVGETKIANPGDLTKAIGKHKAGDKVEIAYQRKGKEQKTTAMLGKREGVMAFDMQRMPEFEALQDQLRGLQDRKEFRQFELLDKQRRLQDGSMKELEFMRSGQPRLGIRAQDTEDGKGVKVLGVDEGSAAEKSGLKEGDIITSFDGSEVNSVGQLVEISRAAREAKKMKMPVKYLREGKEQQGEISIPRKLKVAEL